MSTYKRLKSRGFTLIELMIVVAIVGVLAALAVYGVRKYLLNSKTAEARNGIGQLAKDASLAYTKESMAGTALAEGASTAVVNALCISSSSVPTAIASVKGMKYQSKPSDWDGDALTGWKCLKFTMNDPQYYMYTYAATAGSLFTATAAGDLNGDGTASSFVLGGDINATSKELHIRPNIVETNPEE